MAANVALVVAAGRGVRSGGGTPKQYLPLGGRPMLRHSVSTFLAHEAIDAVAVVIHPDDRALYDAACSGLDLMAPVAGGATRRESVLRGLEALAAGAPERVLIHDAARPFVDAPTVTRVLAALDAAPGAVPAIPVADTLKRASQGRIQATEDRTGLWRAQTPQGFRFDDILAAHRAAAPAAGEEITDDAAVAERAGLAVTLVAGSEENFKITTRDDMARAARLAAAAGEMHTGFGFDAHRFAPGDHLWLCGVRIDHERGLAGHSDADVGLHALTDAILGAIGAGDIGMHFPPSDPAWQGAPSDKFLRHAGDMVAKRGGAIVNLDVTLICEAPRMGPYRDAMVARIAEILELAPGRVSLKATTTDGLGFTGRGEGIAAQAVAMVRLPPMDG